jgi:hypothetical protein
MRKKLLLALTASSVLVLAAATPALAIHNGWGSTTTQGGSTNECNVNPGCTTIEQPKGQEDKKETPSPKDCSGPSGQCK